MAINIKIPSGLSKREVEKTIGEAYNRPDYEMTDKEYRDYLNYHEDKTIIKEIMSPFYDDLGRNPTKDTAKKRIELLDLARYLYHSRLFEEYKIAECLERPDFVLLHQQQRIGVEVTRLWDALSTPQVNTLKGIMSKAETIVKDADISAHGTFNLRVDPSTVFESGLTADKLSKEQRSSLAKSIAAFILSILTQVQAEPLWFVSKVTHNGSAELNIVLSEDYHPPSLTIEILQQLIAKKETKVNGYKIDKHLETVWLLISYNPGTGPSDFRIDESILQYSNNTFYDLIILNDSFRGKAIHWPNNSEMS